MKIKTIIYLVIPICWTLGASVYSQPTYKAQYESAGKLSYTGNSDYTLIFNKDEYLEIKNIPYKSWKTEDGILVTKQFAKRETYKSLYATNYTVNVWKKPNKVFWAKVPYIQPTCTITDEAKEIRGYQCIKAVCDPLPDSWKSFKKVNIWFTPEIPTFAGLLGYVGLPGLVIEFGVDDSRFGPMKLYRLISVEKTDEVITFEPKGDQISTKKLSKLPSW